MFLLLTFLVCFCRENTPALVQVRRVPGVMDRLNRLPFVSSFHNPIKKESLQC